MKKHIFWVVSTFCSLLSYTASGEVPHTVHYQGHLTNAAGEVVDCTDAITCAESYDLVFRLYDASGATVALWEESHVSVPIYQGVFHVDLGGQTLLTAEDFSGPRWLGISVNDLSEMTPRQGIVSSPFAIRAAHAESAGLAQNADQLGGIDAALFVAGPKFSGSYDDLTDVPSDLADGDNDGLNELACGEGMVPKATPAGWVCGTDDLGGVDTTLTEEEVDLMVANNDFSTGAHTVDTTLSDEQVVAIVTGAGHVAGPHTIDTNTQLTEAEVDAFVANNDYATGAHTVDTNTQLTEAEVDAFVANNDYATGAHTVDTNTQLTEAEVDAFVANNDYATGEHTVDTNTQLTEAEVDAFVANNDYASQADLDTVEASIPAVSSSWVDEPSQVRTDLNVQINGTLQVGDGSIGGGTISSLVGTDSCSEGGSLTGGFVDSLPSPLEWTHNYAATGPISSATLTMDIGDADNATLNIVTSHGVLIGTITGADHGGPGPWQCPGGWSENAITIPNTAFSDIQDGSVSFHFENDTGVGLWGVNRAVLEINSGSGAVIVSGSVSATNFFNTSDGRLKDDIRPIENAVEKLLSLRGVRYHFKDRRTGPEDQVGLIAQEVERLYPGLVQTDANGYKGVAYGNLVGVLVEALREQQSEIEQLRRQTRSLEERLNKLESKP